jgi:hypothetical protein
VSVCILVHLMCNVYNTAGGSYSPPLWHNWFLLVDFLMAERLNNSSFCKFNVSCIKQKQCNL